MSVLVTGDGGFSRSVRKVVLACVSPVFEGFLQPPLVKQDTEDRLHIRDVSIPALSLFLNLAHQIAYDCDRECICEEAVVDEITDDLVRLCHMYEATGVLATLKRALQVAPRADAIITVVDYFPENCTWLTPRVMDCVIDASCSDAEKLTALPPPLLVHIVLHLTSYRRESACVGLFRGGIDESIFRPRS